MAKKKHKKKHSFQHKNAPTAVAAPVVAAKSVALTMPNEWSEVRADVAKTLVLGAVFIVLMIGLWVVFESTTIGSSLYNSITL